MNEPGARCTLFALLSSSHDFERCLIGHNLFAESLWLHALIGLVLLPESLVVLDVGCFWLELALSHVELALAVLPSTHEEVSSLTRVVSQLLVLVQLVNLLVSSLNQVPVVLNVSTSYFDPLL